MPVINTSAVIGYAINSIGENIIGSAALTGVWLLILMFGLLSALRIKYAVGVVLLVPVVIVMLAYGYVTPLYGGLILVLVGVIAAFNFMNR